MVSMCHLKTSINRQVLLRLSHGIVLKFRCTFSASTDMKNLTKWLSSKLLIPY